MVGGKKINVLRTGLNLYPISVENYIDTTVTNAEHCWIFKHLSLCMYYKFM